MRNSQQNVNERRIIRGYFIVGIHKGYCDSFYSAAAAGTKAGTWSSEKDDSQIAAAKV